MRLIERPGEARDPLMSVGASLPVELFWVLLAAASERVRSAQGALGAVYEAEPALGERVRGFWDDGVADFGELLVACDQADLLGATELGPVLAGLDEAIAATPGELPLASEPEHERRVFLDRLDQLRRSAERRRAYAELLTAAWSPVEALWRLEGAPAVELAAERYRRQLERGAKWVELLVGDSTRLSEILPSLARLVPPGGSVTIAPSYFSGQGLVFDLPRRLLVGVGAVPTAFDQRARTDPVARRLKALSDPTRLAIVAYLAALPRNVKEISRAFDLAQPTVSNHVKVLRDAGLVVASRQDGRLELALDRTAVARLLDELRAIADVQAEPAGEPPAGA